MAEIKTIVCQSWNDFKSSIIIQLFGDKKFERGVYIFRGHASADWKLMPSFDRFCGITDITDLSGASNQLLSFFRRECEGYDVPKEIFSDDNIALALGQHYGLPTRLLDWTDSPYIASFFAFHESIGRKQEEKYVALWALDTRVKDVWSKDAGVEVLNVPYLGNMRLRNQTGKFTLSNNPYTCLEDHVDSCDTKMVPLKRYLIPAVDFEYALSDLDAMGIKHSMLFPDLTGCALAAKSYFLLNGKK